MSIFIEDDRLREFVHDVLYEEPRRKKTALEISDRIKRHDDYVARAACSCATNSCGCKVTTPSRPTEIEAGDGFEQLAPSGQILRLHALGVRRDPNTDEIFEIFTAGWPAMIVRVPQDGTVKLLEGHKGTGITKEELRHRRKHVGGGWEDGD
jgi:hypothetical protein